MGSKPLGANPPCAVRLPMLGWTPGHKPDTYTPAAPKNKTIAATLMEANQNSNSPKDRTETKFVAVGGHSSVRGNSQAGTPGSPNCSSPGPANRSQARPVTPKNQHNPRDSNPTRADHAGP